MKFVGGIGRAMLSGFNTNFRYRGVLFHVQTEDSGRDNPHVITHLFHGGNILASHKRDYSSLLAGDEVEDAVRKLMEGQHKEMLKQLSRGEHDTVILQRLGHDLFRGDPRTQPERPSLTEEANPTDSLMPPPVGVAEPTASGAMGASANPDAGAIRRSEFASQSASARSEDAQSAPRPSSQLSRVFGERVVSEKPLDEVVMDYLVDNARKRKRQPK